MPGARASRLAATAVAAVLAAGAAVAPRAARADDVAVPVRDARITFDSTLLYITTAFPDLFDPALAAKLDDGFTTTIALRVVVYEVGREEPISLEVRTVKLRYDLWEELYEVKISDYAGVTSLHVATRAEAIAAATTLRRFRATPLALVDAKKTYFMAVRAEVNPTSKELMAEYTRWITRPAGARPPGASKSFFGSFVSLFVNPELHEAAKVFVFRTVSFWVPLP